MRKSRKPREVKNTSRGHHGCALIDRHQKTITWTCTASGKIIGSEPVCDIDDIEYDAKTAARKVAFDRAYEKHVKEDHDGQE